MRKIVEFSVIFIGFLSLVCGCNCNNKVEVESSSISIWPASNQSGNFFSYRGKEFFPMEECIINFTYNSKNKKLDIIRLNSKVSKKTDISAYLKGDTIFIEEDVPAVALNNQKTPVNDIFIKMKNIEPKTYNIDIDGKKYKIDLHDINSKWNYSMMDDGAMMIAMSDQEADEDEL